jgi:hypothetical protein
VETSLLDFFGRLDSVAQPDLQTSASFQRTDPKVLQTQ